MIAYFIRHGKPEYPKDETGALLVYGPDAGLSAEGRAWARMAAESILWVDGALDRIIFSPYRRAAETASVIAAIMDVPTVTYDPDVRDTDSTWPGERIDDFLDVWNERKVFADPRTRETLDQLRARMKAAVHRHTHSFEGRIGFVVHGDPLRAWLYSEGQRFPSYGEVVQATFGQAQGVRLVRDGRGCRREIIKDLTSYPDTLGTMPNGSRHSE